MCGCPEVTQQGEAEPLPGLQGPLPHCEALTEQLGMAPGFPGHLRPVLATKTKEIHPPLTYGHQAPSQASSAPAGEQRPDWGGAGAGAPGEELQRREWSEAPGSSLPGAGPGPWSPAEQSPGEQLESLPVEDKSPACDHQPEGGPGLPHPALTCVLADVGPLLQTRLPGRPEVPGETW